MKLRRIFMSFLIIITVTMILVPLSPLYRLSPGDDPSVYLYVGRQILNGGEPYRDAWDHKQPLAYFVFALAQIFSPNSLWGIWWIEWIALCVMGLLALGLITRLTLASKDSLNP